MERARLENGELNRFFNWAEMPIISSTYWNVVYGTNSDEVMEDTEGLRTVTTLAKKWHGF
jgi:hypothetical protein